MDNPQILAAIISAIGGISGVIIIGLRKFFKKLEEYLSELKPNGGNSLRDKVDRLERGYERLSDRLDEVYQTLIEYTSKHK